MKIKVLVTDDDPLIRRVIQRSLMEREFDVICASHGLEALQLADKERPDVILLDVDMPGLKGPDVLQELRSQFSTRTTPVLFVTGLSSKKDMINGLRSGADDYLTKPVDIDELVARIDSSLRRASINLDANPLTRLPGNHSINAEIQRRLQKGDPFSVLYGDLNDFKVYNDRNGFHLGNLVIQKTAQIFEEMAGEKSTLVGHLGGDDFIIVTERTDVEVLCDNIQRTFKDRTSAIPPISLALGIVNIDRPAEWSLESIAAMSADVKRRVKNQKIN